MKIIFATFFCLLLFSCNNTGDKKEATSVTEETPTSSLSKQETVSKGRTLTQHGDYHALYNREPDDCNFISEEGIAKAIDVSSEKVLKDKKSCTYLLKDPSGNKTSFRFTVQKWNNKQILKEIKTAKKNAETFGKDSKISQYRVSETGDTYLSMHQNRMVRILNENANNIIILYYKTEVSPQEKDVEKINMLKDEALEHSYAIVNYIVNTHQQ